MFPNDNQQTNPINYLDQIAPQPTHRSFSFSNKPVMIGAAVIAVIVFFIMTSMISGLMSSGTVPIKRLSARLSATQETVSSATPQLKNTRLREINSNLKIYLTNTLRDLTPILAEQNIKVNDIDKNIKTEESNTNTLATLEDARLNAVYDRTYAREMAFQLESTLSLMQQIYKSANRQNLKSYLGDAFTNLSPIQKQFADFNAANS